MSNINWGQFINNFANNLSRVNNNLQNYDTETVEEYQNRAIQTYFPAASSQLSKTAAELAVLNQTQTINMVKDLLNFSTNFSQLISQLTVSENQSSRIANILLASNLDLTQLSSLLHQNSKKALSNLYQMMAQYNQIGVSLKDEQINNLVKLISFVNASSNSNVQSLRTIMLMYLPWLPLMEPNAFKLTIANPSNGDGDSTDDYITLLILTENYGNIQCRIYKTQEDGIKIELISSETFPQREFMKLMKDESKKYNININYELSKKQEFNQKKDNHAKTQVSMNVSPGVNPFLLLISNAAIKNIHSIDAKENLRLTRKEKLGNDKS